MVFQSELENIANAEMDRKEFLAYMGAALLALVGVSSILKAVLPPLAGKTANHTQGGYGYGSGVYGGRK